VPRLHIEVVDDEVGRPRHFAEDVGFGIICAASLLGIGLAHETIRLFLAGLLEIRLKTDKSKPALAYVLRRNDWAIAELGDGQFVRLSCEGFDSGWIGAANANKPRRDYVPTTTVRLDIARIRQAVFAAD